MPFRGAIWLNGGELSNSSRVVDHLKSVIPTSDDGLWADPSNTCNLVAPFFPNVLPNPEFALGSAGWSVNGGSWAWNSGAGYNGVNGFLRCTYAGVSAQEYTTTMDVTAGQRVQLQARTRWSGVTGSIGVTIYAIRYDAASGYLGASFVAAMGLTAGTQANWQLLSGIFTVPSDTTAKIALSIVVSNTGSGTVDFDSASMAAENFRYAVPSTTEIRPGLFAPPPGSKLYGPAMFEVDGSCWEVRNFCQASECLQLVNYDDTWPGLREWMDDALQYRVELAPWFSTRIPESGEFAGMWLMDVKGLNVIPIERPISQAVGNGGIAGPHRDSSREIEFDALLIACTNAGLEYGLEWLTCQLRSTKDRSDSVLKYFNAHPSHTAADPLELLRETHGVVYTEAPTITEAYAPAGKSNQQATMYRVTWKMAVTSPYVYLPQVTQTVEWESITTKKVNWVHQADCEQPYTCLDMPVMFSAECTDEDIGVVAIPPPSCGGCMPVCTMLQHSWILDSLGAPIRCNETAVGMTITNNSDAPLSLQAWWRICGSDVRCENSKWPLQVAGLPGGVSLTLDAVSGRYWTNFDGKRWRPRYIVGTPTGAPFRPIVLDRRDCWELVMITSDQVDFDVTVTLADRQP